MFSLELSTPAKEYFEDLKNYLINNFNEKKRKAVLDEEDKKLKNLKSFPELGIDAVKYSPLLAGYRALVDKKEYIFYRVNKDEKIISVELIVSTKEDLGRKIQKYFA